MVLQRRKFRLINLTRILTITGDFIFSIASPCLWLRNSMELLVQNHNNSHIITILWHLIFYHTKKQHDLIPQRRHSSVESPFDMGAKVSEIDSKIFVFSVEYLFAHLLLLFSRLSSNMTIWWWLVVGLTGELSVKPLDFQSQLMAKRERKLGKTRCFHFKISSIRIL